MTTISSLSTHSSQLGDIHAYSCFHVRDSVRLCVFELVCVWAKLARPFSRPFRTGTRRERPGSHPGDRCGYKLECDRRCSDVCPKLCGGDDADRELAGTGSWGVAL